MRVLLFMKVKLIDENHEKDLEDAVNKFLSTVKSVVDIKYQVAIMFDMKEQIYCYSAIVIYKDYYDSIKNDSNVIDKINQYLAEKSALYMSARRAGIFQLNGDKRIAVWNFDAVLLNEVDYVAIVKNENTNDHILVTWDTFLKTKGVRYEQISRNSDLKYYYIYRVSNNEIDEMYNEFNKNAISLEKN